MTAPQPKPQEYANLTRLLEMAIAEDMGSGDITSGMLPADVRAEARLVARQGMVLCGGVFMAEIAHAYDADSNVRVLVAEGQSIDAGDVIAIWTGRARTMLSAERVVLNFMQRLSGIATLTSEYVQAVAGTQAGIYDTRKTTPGWRELEKYAVRAGGGRNHRRGLYDAALIKDNHLAVLAADGCQDPITVLGAGFDDVRKKMGPEGFIQIEVDTMEQFAIAIGLEPDIILLDNMSADTMKAAVRLRDEVAAGGKRVELEASGGITLETVSQAAGAGVDRISVGALTHSAQAVDIGMDIDVG